MSMHYGISIIMLVMNLGLMFFYPAEFDFCSNQVVTMLFECHQDTNSLSSTGDYQESLDTALSNADSSLFSPIFMILDFLKLLFNLFFALPSKLLFTDLFFEQIGIRIFIGAPVFFSYMYSFVSFIRLGK